MPNPLQFNSDGKFTITQLTDLHYRNGETEDLRSLALMRDILDAEKPGLVVLTGDVIDGSFCRDPIRSYGEVVQPIIDRGLPWAAVFGNHDDEGSAKREQLMAAMQKLSGCLSVPGPPDLTGVGNYILTIAGKDGPAARLYLVDSHAYADETEKNYDWIRQDQIDWYLNSPHDLPALMFFHIPLCEYDDVWNTGQCTGSKNEPVCCPQSNSGMFTALKSAGDVMGVFVGHDHTNDYCGSLSGIQLCYGRSSGFSSYGKEGFPRGARRIELRSGDTKFDTSVILI
jgi:hypothetical protein